MGFAGWSAICPQETDGLHSTGLAPCCLPACLTLLTLTAVQLPMPLAPGPVCAVHESPLSVESHSCPPWSAARTYEPLADDDTLVQGAGVGAGGVLVLVQLPPPSVDRHTSPL